MSLQTLFSRPAIWIYTLLILVVNIVVLIAISRVVAPSLLIEHDSGLAVDHIAFWAAGVLANQGIPAAAYDPVALTAVQRAGLGYEYIGGMNWFYPPLAQILTQPFAYFSLAWSFILWNTVGLAAYIFVAWRVWPDLLAVLVAATSGVFVAMVSGQIGLFIAAISGLCLLSLQRGEGGGGWLALLLLKPQTVFAIPVALALAGRWRPIVVACLVGGVLIVASAMWLGVEVWVTFLGTLAGTAEFFMVDPTASVLWDRYVSAYGVALYHGAPVWLATMLHAIVALVALAAAGVALRRLGPTNAAMAIILYAAVVSAPRIYTYDLPLLGVAALFHARAACEEGWIRWEPPFFAAAFLLIEIAYIAYFQAAALIGPLLLIGACARHVFGRTSELHCN